MQEGRNIRLIISLVILTVAATLIFLLKNDKVPVVDKNLFKITDLKSVDAITLQFQQQTVELVYNGARWRVNNQYDADRNMIDVLFATLEQAEPKRPMAGAMQDSTSKAITANGVHVSLRAGGKLVQSFWAGGNERKTQAYFKKEDGTTAYLMTIPGYRVYVSGIFELPEAGWRDKYIFGFNWRNFKGMEVQFPEAPSAGFDIVRKDQFFGIDGMVQTDTAKLNSFIDAVSLLTTDQYLDSAVADSLKLLSPIIILKVTDIANRQYELKLFSGSAKDRPVRGLLNNVEGVLFDQRKVQPILKPRKFFE